MKKKLKKKESKLLKEILSNFLDNVVGYFDDDSVYIEYTCSMSEKVYKDMKHIVNKL